MNSNKNNFTNGQPSQFGNNGYNPNSNGQPSQFGNNGCNPNSNGQPSQFGNNGCNPNSNGQPSQFGNNGCNPNSNGQPSQFGNNGCNPNSNGQPSQFGNNDNKIETKAENKFDKGDSVFAWLSFLAGFLISRSLPIWENTLGGMITILFLFIFGNVYLKVSKKRIKARFCVVTALSFAFSFGLINNSNYHIRNLLYFFLIVAFLYFIYSAFNYENVFGGDLFIKLLKAVFVVPFEYIGKIYQAFVIKGNSKKAKTVLYIFIGLLCAIIPTAIVISLLSYDSQFVEIIKSIFDFTLEKCFELIFDIALGLFFAMLIFGALYGSKRSWKEKTEKEQKNTGILQIVPKSILCATFTPVLLVYVIFFISQWDYYVSAFTKTLPETLSYATYAREGFFQLCIVCVFNAVILFVFHTFAKRNGKKRDGLVVGYSSIISVFTLILIATALSKMLLYISSYGLTRLRVYSSWMILLLSVFFIIVLLYQFINKISLVPSFAIAFVIFFGLISIPNLDGFIAQYNVDKYISGDLKQLDVYTLEEYGESSVEALFTLYDHLEEKDNLSHQDEDLYKRVNNTLFRIKKADSSLSENESIFKFNVQKHKAKKLYSSHKKLEPIPLVTIEQ